MSPDSTIEPLRPAIVRWALSLIVALYIAQQLAGFSLRWVDDETWYLLPAKSLSTEGRIRIPVFSGADQEFWAAPPLMFVLQAISWRLHEMSIVQARALTLAFGVGAILATFAFGRRILGDRVGLVAAAFCAVDNMLYLAGRTVRPEIVVTCLTMAALWLLAKAVQENKSWPAAISGLLVGAAISTHPNGAVAAVCGALFLLFYQGVAFLRRPQIYVLTIASILAVVPMVANVMWHDGAYGANTVRQLLSLHEGRSTNLWANLTSSIKGEVVDRYVPFMMFPYRVPIAVLTVAAVVWGLVSRRRATVFLALSVVSYVLFFAFVAKANKTPRYTTCFMPFVALIWAEWVVLLWRQLTDAPQTQRKAKRLAAKLALASIVLFFGLSPIAGNAAYLWKNRHANVAAVCREIDAKIPSGSTIYGGMAFWIGLPNHTYVPYMRMPWPQAVAEFRPTIVILDDWVMVKGSYPGEWDALRQELHEYVAKHGSQLGTVDNDFYGELKIYQINYDE